MKYTFDSRIRYTETGTNGILTIPATVNYLQDCTTFQSEDLGLGVQYLTELHRAWVLNSWHIQLDQKLCENDRITVSTWSCGSNGVAGLRDFTIENGRGEICVRAHSVWAYVDTENGRLCRVTDQELAAYGIHPPLEMRRTDRKIRLPKEMAAAAPFGVRLSDLDSNRHVNNGKYVQMAVDLLPEDFEVNDIRVEYRSSAHLGDMIYPRLAQEGNSYSVSLCGEDGKPYANLAFAYDQE